VAHRLSKNKIGYLVARSRGRRHTQEHKRSLNVQAVSKHQLWGGHLWEASYFARAVGDGVTAEMVKRYIEHHAEKAQGSAPLSLFPAGKD